ncbi:uncharacterized protein Bfra_004923 [Botrytis fragariae]|uniref:Uncharacterized protein n=1 Tax=Botrytis fragariae TaxID=1964551 RepID=A0A8H6ATS2_9HELO|nr:uncharacterized protein Bfra_004923 [Botrytis fragariae]KAF5873462.1 hypothetical protein Bfra_004923 [Botrytis fragariae]
MRVPLRSLFSHLATRYLFTNTTFKHLQTFELTGSTGSTASSRFQAVFPTLFTSTRRRSQVLLLPLPFRDEKSYDKSARSKPCQPSDYQN